MKEKNKEKEIKAGENKRHNWVKIGEDDVQFVLFGRKKLRSNQKEEEVTLVNEGESLSGLIKDIRPSSKYGKVYILRCEQFEKDQLVTGTYVLNRKLAAADIGNVVKIEYEGMKTSPNGDYHDFLVWLDKEED